MLPPNSFFFQCSKILKHSVKQFALCYTRVHQQNLTSIRSFTNTDLYETQTKFYDFQQIFENFTKIISSIVASDVFKWIFIDFINLFSQISLMIVDKISE